MESATDSLLIPIQVRVTSIQKDALDALSELTGDERELIVRKALDLYIRIFTAGQSADETMRGLLTTESAEDGQE